MRRAGPDLRTEFADHLEELAVIGEEDRLLVALSGGLDSMVLLHLLLDVSRRSGLELAAAHLDHAMRPGSAGDAAWVRGVTRAWNVPLHEGRLAEPPASEAEARRARYAFLEEARRSTGSRWIVTAHHADDQAETVLFRILRGTGPTGLGGIRAVRRKARLIRPLLPWWREELEAYAARERVPWRTDPTNEQTAYARNVLRHEVLPLAESRVAPGSRRALVRLARLARRDEAGWRSVVGGVLDEVVRESSGSRIVVGRTAFLSHHPTVRARALRRLVKRLGPTLDEAGTRAALQFTSSGASGRRLTLPEGVVLARDFDTLILSTGEAPERSRGAPARGIPERDSPARAAIHIREAGTGEERLTLGGRSWLVRWSRAGRPSGRWVERFHPSHTAFPLLVRGWAPGDRMDFPFGSKKVAKLFAEDRVAAAERRRRPLLEDARGRIVWVPGVSRSADRSAPSREGSGDGDDDAFTIAIEDADD